MNNAPTHAILMNNVLLPVWKDEDAFYASATAKKPVYVLRPEGYLTTPDGVSVDAVVFELVRQ